MDYKFMVGFLCGVGDDVWIINPKSIIRRQITGIGIDRIDNEPFYKVHSKGFFYEKDFGRRIFLSEREAQEAHDERY